MRTKTLLCAAALAAGVATSMAQSNVYSLNVVGYVNVVIPGNSEFSVVCNPLNNTNNNITNIFPASAMKDGCYIQIWNPATFDFDGFSPSFSSFLNKWVGDFVLKPGQGIFFNNPDSSDITNTFVGEVIQGPYTNNLVGNSSFNLIGSSAPIGNSFTNAIGGLAPADGDSISTWNAAAFDYDPVQPTYSSFLNAWDTTTVQIPPGRGFFYVRSGGDVAWVRNFTVQ